jgi:hypothetical protein
MQVGVQLNAPAALLPGNKPGTHSIGGWVDSTALHDIWKGEKSVAVVGIRTPVGTARSLVTILTELSQLPDKAAY